ncbi:MAG: type VI secretion system protein TssA [Gammaproteobacteria bacterium]|nr:type VI secretion system protein TssA [Gammaproteobacteria bacterium]
MASPETVDIDSLLQPISDDKPVGNDIREDSSPNSSYYTLKDARNAARAAERNSMFDGGSSEADDNWRKIRDLAPKILKDEAKDLEVACWYCEALIRSHSFQGLRDGFKIVRQLIEQYWDDIYPLPDEDGIETRIAPLIGLNGEGAEGVLITPIRNVKLTQGQSVGPYTLWQYQQTLDIQKIIDEEQRTQRIAKNGFSIDDVNTAVSESSQEFYIDMIDDLESAIAEFRQIGSMLDERCGIHEAPPTSNIVNTLQDFLGSINHLAKYKLPAEEIVETGVENTEMTNQGAAPTVVAKGPVQNRDDAFRQLNEIADFFRKTEPHSPISYVLQKAVNWGEMPLCDLIKELIPDSSSRDFYSSLTGVKVNDEY